MQFLYVYTLTNKSQVCLDRSLKHIKAGTELQNNAKPKFHKAYPVPYAFCPKVEAEAKMSTDKVCICGDVKVTVNPVIPADQYPLPRIDDIFASLANGECFTKMTLAQASLQMEMDESSHKYLTINTHKGSTTDLCLASQVLQQYGNVPWIRRYKGFWQDLRNMV